jgi:alkanesulfonate monooxygenase SsuD/methylene tetrahydromethanopterin reductase-like flavin-dependent oxidoreductase (luciferase family)
VRIGVALLPEFDWIVDQERWAFADASGFDHAWLYDHLAWRSLADGPWHATMPTLTAAALTTERIRLGTLVTTPNFRHPVPLAKDLMTLDVISRGRLMVATGAGAPSHDARVLGGEPLSGDQRRARFEEFHSLLDLLLSSPHSTRRGAWYSAVDARMVPGPAQRPRPPILVAADGPRGIRLAAERMTQPGDGWVTMGPRDHGLPETDWWTVVSAAASTMRCTMLDLDRDVDQHPRLLYLGDRSTTDVKKLRDQVRRASDCGFTDLVLAWPRREQPFQGDVRKLEAIAAALPSLRGPGV